MSVGAPVRGLLAVLLVVLIWAWHAVAVAVVLAWAWRATAEPGRNECPPEPLTLAPPPVHPVAVPDTP